MKFHTLLQAYEKHLHKVWHHGLLVAWLSIVGIGLIFSYQALSNSSHARYIKSTLQTVSNRLAPNPALDEVPRPLTGIILDDEPVWTGSTWFDNTIRYLDEIRCNRTGTSTNPIVFLNRTVSSISSPATRVQIYHSSSPDVHGPLNLMWTPLISDRHFMMTMSSRDYQLFRLKTVDNYGNQVWQEMQYICKDDHFVDTPANTWNNNISTDLSINKSYSVLHESASWTILRYTLTVNNNGSANINLPFTVTDLVWEHWWYLNVNSCSLACTTYPSASHPGFQNASWTIPSLWAYQSYTITYNVYVDPSITTYTNQACVSVTWWIIDTNYTNNCMSVSYTALLSNLICPGCSNTGTNNTSTWVIYGYGYGYQPWYGYGYGYGYMWGRYGANKPYFYLTKPYLMISEKIYKKFKDVYTTGIKKLSKTALVRLFDKKTLRTMKRDVEVYLTKQIQSIASSKVLTVSQRLEQLRKFATYKWQAQVQYKELIDKK